MTGKALSSESSTPELKPPEGWRHFGCPYCGRTFTLPAESDEAPPWCVSHGGSYSWNGPHAVTQAGPRPWTQMVPVKVERA